MTYNPQEEIRALEAEARRSGLRAGAVITVFILLLWGVTSWAFGTDDARERKRFDACAEAYGPEGKIVVYEHCGVRR